MTIVVLLISLPASDFDDKLWTHSLNIMLVWILLRLFGITDSLLTNQEILDEHNTDVGQALALSYFEGFISKALSNEDGVLRNIETNTVTGANLSRFYEQVLNRFQLNIHADDV